MISTQTSEILQNKNQRRRLGILLIAMLAIRIAGCHHEPDGITKDASSSTGDVTQPASPTDPVSAVNETQSSLRFEDIASALGINHQYLNGEESGHYSILESLGGGVAMIDCDGDGLLDLVATGGGRFQADGTPAGLATEFFRQTQGSPRFKSVADVACLSRASYYTHGVHASDFDNDGFVDLLITGYGGLQFFCNLGDGTFEETAADRGLTDALWSSSAAWGDFNADGAADLYVAHYVDWSPDRNKECLAVDEKTRDVCSPRQFSGLPDSLFLSLGDGQFRDASSDFGTIGSSKGLGVVTGDIDRDADVDVYVTNDTEKNCLLVNQSNTTFVDQGESSGTAYGDTGREEGSMGVDLCDFNNDGHVDIGVANYENETFAMYRNFNGQFFQHVSRSTGIAAAGGLSVGWGTLFLDLDIDGDEDLFVANGHVIRYPQNAPLQQPPLVLLNDHGQRFSNIAKSIGDYTAAPHMGRGIAAGDLDADGDLDIAVSCLNQPLAILRNSGTASGNWLAVRLIGRQSTRHPIGATVEVQLTDGTSLLRLQKGGTSYASSSQPDLHFGIGKSHAQKLRIQWPSGQIQRVDLPLPNAVTTVIESASESSHGPQ